MKSWRADLALAGITVVWGSTFVLVKNALADISPVYYLALRFTLAAALLAIVYAKALTNPLRHRESIRAGCVAGVFLFGGYLFQTLGLELTTPSKSAFLTGLSIPMVPLASALVYKKVPRLLELLGVGIASAGMALMTLPSGKFQMDRGDFLSFLCAVAFAAHIVTVGYYSARVSFEVFAVAQIAGAALLCLAMAAGTERTFPLRVSPRVCVAVLIGGVLATALAFTVQAWAQQYTTATRTALIFSLEPVVAWSTSFWLTGETLSRQATAGAVFILFGILLVELKRSNAGQHQSSSAA